MLRNLKVGTKLFVILAAPMVVVLLLVGIGVRERQGVADGARRVEQLAGFASATSDLAGQLRAEAVRSALVTGSSDTAARQALDAQRAKTDAALKHYLDELHRTNPMAAGGTLAASVRLADTRLDGLPGIRGAVDSDAVEGYAQVGLYDGVVNSLVATNASLSQVASDPALLRGLDAAVQVERIAAAQGSQGGLLTAAADTGAFVDTAGQRCLTVTQNCESWDRTQEATNSLAQAQLAFLQSGTTPAQKQAVQNAAGGPQYADLSGNVLTEGSTTNRLTVTGSDMAGATLAAQSGLATVDADFLGSVVSTARSLEQRASQAVTWYLLGGVGGLAIAFAIAVAVARSVTRPLARLTGAAHRLSDEQLPALVAQLRDPEDLEAGELAESLTPIEIDSRDEIGQLATAFNDLQSVTVEVAEEQHRLLRKGIGDLFVNLARRNQSLLDRQIEFIDQLEENERDPDQLDNLFRLDHLATRMRRNAESLLVLAGAEPVRRRGRPVPVSDVVRVAIGEVEQFSRIHLIALDEATVMGNAAVDLAHLLSELMENATASSPPETDVEVLGQRTEQNGYEITVTDRGIGMGAEQMAEANALLAKPPAVGLTLSRSLGFTVVGRLAARLGLRVRLEPGPDRGVRARVSLPFTLVEYADDDADREPSFEESLAALGASVPTRVPGLGHLSPRAAPEPDELVTGPQPPAGPTDEPAPAPEPPAAPVRRIPAARPATPIVRPEPTPLPPREPVRAYTEGGLPVRPSSRAASPAAPEGPGPAAAPGEDPGVAPRVASAAPPAAAATGGVTASGLVRRTPTAAGSTAGSPPTRSEQSVTRTNRSPEEVRRMLSRYRTGLTKGRGSASHEPADAGARQEERG